MNALINSMSGAPLTMTSREIADLVNLRHDNVRRTIETLADRGVIGLPQIEEIPSGPAGGRPGTEYIFSGEQGKRDTYVVVGQLCPEFLAAVVDRWQQLEKEAAAAAFNVPKTMWEALRLAADVMEQRDEAIRTKAEIGHRREATAMATASVATKKANKLERELDRSMQYATVKRMAAMYQNRDFNWRELKKGSDALEIASIAVFDANYGTVKAYHADVWRKVYGVEILRQEAMA